MSFIVDWNTFVQEVIHKETSQKRTTGKILTKTKKNLKQFPYMLLLRPNKKRIITPDVELNRVLGAV